jgi:hypothetical protein
MLDILQMAILILSINSHKNSFLFGKRTFWILLEIVLGRNNFLFHSYRRKKQSILPQKQIENCPYLCTLAPSPMAVR